MHSAAKIALALAAFGGIVGGIAYWEHGAYARLCERGARESLSDKEWSLLTDEHIDDPAVLPAVAFELAEASAGGSCKDSFTRADDHVGPILARQTTSDDVSLQAIAHMMTRCNEPKLLTWTSRPAADLVKTIHDREIATLHLAPANVLPDLLLGLKPKVDQDLVDVVVASTKPEPSSVDAFWTNGFPADGADFTSGGETVAPGTDPRPTHGIAQWLWSLQDAGIEPEAARAMLRVLDHVTPPQLDEKIAHAIGLANGKEPEAIELCRRLATAADKDLVAKTIPNESDRTGCLAALADSQAVRAELSGKDGTDAKIAALIEMGPKATLALRDALLSKDVATRRIAEKSLAVIDRHAFASAIAKSFRAGVADGDDAALAEPLLTDPPLELDAWLSLFATGNEAAIKSAIAFVKDKSKPEDWVPAVFQARDPKSVAGDKELLESAAKVTPIVGAILTRELNASHAPEKVDALTKYLALTVLRDVGTAKDAAAIEPFVSDPSTFQGAPIGALATQALAAAKAR